MIANMLDAVINMIDNNQQYVIGLKVAYILFNIDVLDIDDIILLLIAYAGIACLFICVKYINKCSRGRTIIINGNCYLITNNIYINSKGQMNESLLKLLNKKNYLIK